MHEHVVVFSKIQNCFLGHIGSFYIILVSLGKKDGRWSIMQRISGNGEIDWLLLRKNVLANVVHQVSGNDLSVVETLYHLAYTAS